MGVAGRQPLGPGRGTGRVTYPYFRLRLRATSPVEPAAIAASSGEMVGLALPAESLRGVHADDREGVTD